MNKKKILYITRESFPSFRADIEVLFGKYLPKHNIHATIVAEKSALEEGDWMAGTPFLYKTGKLKKISFFFQGLLILQKNIPLFDAVQVRDKAITAISCILLTKLHKKPLYFWMSWPFAEDDLERVKVSGSQLGTLKKIYFFIRGYLLKVLQYKVLFRCVDHIFVQSDAMKKWLENLGVNPEKMTAVPMGVDLRKKDAIVSGSEPSLKKSRHKTVAYLGQISMVRDTSFLLRAFQRVIQNNANITLLLIGGPPLGQDIQWFEEELAAMGLADNVHVTGWVNQQQAWQHLLSADLAVNMIPRNILFDTSSPTKILEYAALGIPCIVSDNPDQLEMIQKLQCGRCIPYDEDILIQNIEELLSDENLLEKYAKNGILNIGRYRSYEIIAENLAEIYTSLIKK